MVSYIWVNITYLCKWGLYIAWSYIVNASSYSNQELSCLIKLVSKNGGIKAIFIDVDEKEKEKEKKERRMVVF